MRYSYQLVHLFYYCPFADVLGPSNVLVNASRTSLDSDRRVGRLLKNLGSISRHSILSWLNHKERAEEFIC